MNINSLFDALKHLKTDKSQDTPGDIASIIQNLQQGRFTIFDYSLLLPYLSPETLNLILSKIQDLKSDKIHENIQLHKYIISGMSIEQQKLDPNMLNSKEDLESIVAKVNQPSVNVEVVKEFIKLIKLLRSMGPLFGQIVKDGKVNEGLLKNLQMFAQTGNVADLLKATLDPNHSLK